MHECPQSTFLSWPHPWFHTFYRFGSWFIMFWHKNIWSIMLIDLSLLPCNIFGLCDVYFKVILFAMSGLFLYCLWELWFWVVYNAFSTCNSILALNPALPNLTYTKVTLSVWVWLLLSTFLNYSWWYLMCTHTHTPQTHPNKYVFVFLVVVLLFKSKSLHIFW